MVVTMAHQSTPKNTAVVELNHDKTLRVIPVFQLVQFNPSWIDNTSLWNDVRYWDNNYEEIGCKVLVIDTLDNCKSFEQQYIQSRLKNSSSPSDNLLLVTEIAELKLQVEFLTNMLYAQKQKLDQQQEEIMELKNAIKPNISKSSIYTVGSHQMLVPLNSLLLYFGMTFNGTTFMSFAEEIIGPKFYVGKSMTELDCEIQSKLDQLMAFYALSWLCFETRTNPKPSEIYQKYDLLRKSTVQYLNNLKTRGKGTEQNDPIHHKVFPKRSYNRLKNRKPSQVKIIPDTKVFEDLPGPFKDLGNIAHHSKQIMTDLVDLQESSGNLLNNIGSNDHR